MMASAKLYVGNLSYNTTQETLTQLFSGEGRTVKDVFLATDKISGRSRGFAFVEMSTKEEALACITALDGKDVDGRAIRVSEARERQEGGAPQRRFNNDGPGRGGRSSFGGGYQDRGGPPRSGGPGGRQRQGRQDRFSRYNND